MSGLLPEPGPTRTVLPPWASVMRGTGAARCAGRPPSRVRPVPSQGCPHTPLVALFLVAEERVYGGRMLDLSRLDLEEIATALADQTDYEHRWLINPQTGEIVFWTTDGGIDGHTPVDLDDLDLVGIEPLPSYVWYQDMADFAERISDAAASRRLARAIQGPGAFRRFKNELHDEYPQLLPAWYAFRDVRARRRAVEWLVDNSLVDDQTGERFVAEHPDPDRS